MTPRDLEREKEIYRRRFFRRGLIGGTVAFAIVFPVMWLFKIAVEGLR